jgi:hypothetical protein
VLDVAHMRFLGGSLLIMGGIILWAIGMLADQVSKIGLAMKAK